MQHLSTFLAVTLLCAAPALAQDPKIALPEVYTAGSAGLTSPESLRWNVLNPPLPAPIVGPMCSVTLSFHTGQGELLKSETITLKAGESRSLILSATEFPSTGNPTGIYAVAVLPVTGAVDQPQATCPLITTMEVFDSATGKSSSVTRGARVRRTGLRPAAVSE